MLEREASEAIAKKLLASIPADEAEAFVTANKTGSTRFASNAITQNVEESTRSIRLRVIKNGRQGVASGNADDAGALDSLVSRALKAAEHSSPDSAMLPMIDAQPQYQAVEAFNRDTFEASPRARAERILEQLTVAEQHGLEGAGLFTTGGGSCLYSNTHGVSAYHQSSIAGFSMSAFAEDGAVEGSADATDHNINSLSTRRVGNTAMQKAMEGKRPKAIEAGAYDVVLERAALAEVFLMLSWLGFAAQGHIEGRSGLSGKMGKKLFSDKLTMRADPYDLRFEGRAFDGEGFPTKAVTLIENGIAKNLPHDRRTAKALGGENTGYAVTQPDPSGPYPRDVVVKEGDATIEKMIESTERGLLVTTFHYTNIVDPMAMTITGMTRGGVWLIERGKIKHPVKNLRFTESLFKALANIEMVGNISEPVAAGCSAAVPFCHT